MAIQQTHRRLFLQVLAAGALGRRCLAAQVDGPGPGIVLDAGSSSYHVHPGGQIQEALELAAKDRVNKTIYVHEGIYRPRARGQALIWFNARHDGITLQAVGHVTLTAANADVADPQAHSAPAVVNHVVYFGDGVSRTTVLRGFTITGANNFTMGSGQQSPIESDDIRKSPYFYVDGGGIKIYARSYPTLEDLEIASNYTSPCAGGVSVEHLGAGRMEDSVLFRNCIFRDNRTQITGAALDLLHGSRATIENCLFVGNVSNMGVDYVGLFSGGEYHPQNGSGALTVFDGSRAIVSRSTFTGNWNGVDGSGAGSAYVDSIFWNNTRPGGISPGPRYELDLSEGTGVRGCFIHGDVNDLRGTIPTGVNTFDPPDPRFDARYIPQAPAYAGVGYRPSGSRR